MKKNKNSRGVLLDYESLLLNELFKYLAHK